MTAIDLDEDRLNLEIRKFLKQVGVTSQREIEKAMRDAAAVSSAVGFTTRRVVTHATNRAEVKPRPMRSASCSRRRLGSASATSTGCSRTRKSELSGIGTAAMTWWFVPLLSTSAADSRLASASRSSPR